MENKKLCLELTRHLSLLDTKKRIASHTPNLYTHHGMCVQTSLRTTELCPRSSSMKTKTYGIRYFSNFRIGFGNLKNVKVKKLCSVITEAVMVKCSYMSRLEQVEVDCAAYCATGFITWFMMCGNDLPPLNFLRKSVSTLFAKY